MRHWLAPLLALALVALLGAAQARYVAGCTEVWGEALAEAAACAQREDWDGARAALFSLSHAWEDRLPRLRAMLGHDALEEIALRLAALQCCAEAEDGAEFHSLTAELTVLLRALREAEELHLANIL